MTTVQESPNGHRLFPPPFSVENALGLNRADLPANKADSHSHIDTQKLPDRCQFTFTDGRQCTMARSDIHPSLCRFHAEREDQLFGEPLPAGYVVGRALDLPELYSACRDLTTAAGVNRVLTQVFRLLAQRRISRQEAATFGHLAQLLLRTISLMRVESADPARSSGESHGHQELSPVNKVQRESRDLSASAPVNKVMPPLPATKGPSQPEIPTAACELPPISRTSSSASTKEPVATPNPAAHNPRRMNTSENAEFKSVQNQHLQKNGKGATSSPVR